MMVDVIQGAFNSGPTTRRRALQLSSPLPFFFLTLRHFVPALGKREWPMLASMAL